MKRSILYLTPGIFDKGGIARYGRFQVTALRESFPSHEVNTISLMGRRDGDFEEAFEAQWSGPTGQEVPARGRFVVACAAAVLRSRPAVLVTAHVHLGPVGWVLARMSGAPFVQVVYARELWSGLGSARRGALRRADLVISDCNNSADRAVEMKLVRERPRVVWDCVDQERFSPAPPDWAVLERYSVHPATRFRLLFLARLNRNTRYKGSERFLNVLARLPAGGFCGVVAGRGDDLDHLRQRARDLGIVDRTVFTGPIHECDMAAVYRACDAFFLASSVGKAMGEGLPLTPLEAMACGKPVLVGNQDGSREILAGNGGFCGDPEDIEGQLAYVMKLKTDREFRSQEEAAARDRILEAFTYEEFRRKTERVFAPLIAPVPKEVDTVRSGASSRGRHMMDDS